MRCVLVCMLEAVEGRLCLQEVREVLDVPIVILCVVLRMLEAIDGRLCLLDVPDVMRCVLLCMPEVMEGRLCVAGGVGRAGGAGRA